MTCVFMHDGTCTRGLHGGRPSRGVCSICDDYRGPLRGAGDIVAVVAQVTGTSLLTKTISEITGKPCGCGERRAALNAAVPFPDKTAKE